MAEFLIYNKEHWMDSLTQEQIDAYSADSSTFMDKYEARFQKGDIVEVRPDGYWTSPSSPGVNEKTFKVICVPGKIVDCELMKTLYDASDLSITPKIKRRSITPKIKRRRAYQIDTTSLTTAKIEELDNTNFTRKLTLKNPTSPAKRLK